VFECVVTFPQHCRVRERDLAALEKEAGDRLEAAKDFEAGVAAREKTARSQILNAKLKRGVFSRLHPEEFRGRELQQQDHPRTHCFFWWR